MLALVAVAVLVRQPFPQTDGELTLAGLDAEVTVLRDDAGIPQLYGDSIADLMKAQGFVHAQERFFEMDVRRHITSGRLSELFGEATVETDTFVRTLGWREVAEKEVALLDPETRAAFEAYADGVNAYLQQTDHRRARAGVLGARPRRPRLRAGAVDHRRLAGLAEGDGVGPARQHRRRDRPGADPVDELRGAWSPSCSRRTTPSSARPIVTQGAVVDGVFDQDATGGSRLPERPGVPVLAGGARRAALGGPDGSTGCRPSSARATASAPTAGWCPASAPRPASRCSPTTRTSASACPASGCRWACTAATVSEDCPLDVSGFTFSGTPGVVIGHNADIAWGFTNLGPDVTDLYLEKVDGDRWRHDGAAAAALDARAR